MNFGRTEREGERERGREGEREGDEEVERDLWTRTKGRVKHHTERKRDMCRE